MTPHKLLALSVERKSVVDGRGIRMPAAFVVSQQFRYVMLRLDGMKVYKPRKSKTPRWKQNQQRLENLDIEPT